MILIRRLVRNGNSVCVSIPRAIVGSLGLQIGDNVALFVEDGRMILRRVTDAELVGPRTEAAAADLFHERRE